MDQPKKKKKTTDQPKGELQQASPPQQPDVPVEVVQFLRQLADEVQRQGRFTEVYANNFHFEPSVWDFKVLLGELDQQKGASFVNWHTSVTIPWLQVKLVAYFLRLNVAWYEHQNGPLSIPPGVMPNRPELSADDPSMKAWQEVASQLYDQMFGETK